MGRSPEPSEVRERVLAEHASLRRVLLDVEARARAGFALEDTVTQLADVVPHLAEAVQHHLDFEEEELAPVLRWIDAWGQVRVLHLLEGHLAQRRALLEVLRATTDHSDTLAAQLLTLVDDLRGEMAREERDILDAALLRDDIIAIEQFDG